MSSTLHRFVKKDLYKNDLLTYHDKYHVINY